MECTGLDIRSVAQVKKNGGVILCDWSICGFQEPFMRVELKKEEG